MIDYKRTYNEKIRKFCSQYKIDRETAAGIMRIAPNSFSRLTGEKSMYVSKSITLEEYIHFMICTKNILEKRANSINDFIQKESIKK